MLLQTSVMMVSVVGKDTSDMQKKSQMDLVANWIWEERAR